MRTKPDANPGRQAPWIPLSLAVVLVAAGLLGGSFRPKKPEPSAAAPKTESAGSPASSSRPFASSADSGASPSLPAGAFHGLVPAASPKAFRSPLEQSPGYFPPDDPESMSVITGRRAASRVPGEFTGGAPTFETLLQAVLVAVERNDERTLHDLRVTRGEFERFVWRELPQSRPIANIQAEDAWTFMQHGSLAGAGRAIGSFGGRRLAVVSVASSGPIAYTNFTLWRDIVITARDESSGDTQTLRFLPAVAERRGRFKVFSYKD